MAPGPRDAPRRVAFVTGASRGIGAATARALAARGFAVVLTARTLAAGERHDHAGLPGEPDAPLPGSLEQTAAAIADAGGEALPLRLDLLEPTSWAEAVDAAEARWGPVEVLVNNAIAQTRGAMARVADLAGEDLERVYRGNVVAPLWLARRLLPGMRGRGAVVNLVSGAGASDPPAPTGAGGWGFAYGSSKAALARLVGVLAVEHPEPGLRLFNVEPGYVVTEAVRAAGLDAKLGARWRGAPPEVPAAVIAWLVSEDAARAWHARTVDAQKLCKELGLVPGWPPAVP